MASVLRCAALLHDVDDFLVGSSWDCFCLYYHVLQLALSSLSCTLHPNLLCLLHMVDIWSFCFFLLLILVLLSSQVAVLC